MAREQAHRIAEQKIEEAQRSGANDLELSGRYNDENQRLDELPQSLGQLTQLQSLDLSNNQLAALPDWLGRLTRLQSLDLSGNRLTALPDWLGQLTELQSLNLSLNEVAILPESLGRLAQLQSLDLIFNKLTTLPKSFGQLTQLRVLDLARNELTELPPSLGKMILLESLNLRGNELKELPQSLGKLNKLRSLDLRGNELTELPSSLGELTRCTMDLSHNPFNRELAAAYEEGFDAVKRYLRAKAGALVELNEAKLILIGEGEVGKSCLLGALRGDEWVENRNTTHGIEIKSVKVTDSQSDTEITLNCWDFGGQKVYRPTHQLFFSSPAVYLVVWKPREGPQQGFVKEWIKLVKHREPEAKIFVVATHGGPGARQPDIDRQELWDTFGRDTVVDFFHVDCRPGSYDEARKKWSGVCTGIAELRNAIAEIAANLPEMGRSVPKSWQEARTEMKNIKSAHISTSQAVKICAKHQLGEEDARLFLTIEHRLGHLIHYAHDTTLRDIVVLKPDWLATAISFVLDDKNTRDAHGLVSFQSLGELWNDKERAEEFRYPPDLHSVFVRLMERYDLSYRVANLNEPTASGGTYLIAQLVPDVKPTTIGGWASGVPFDEKQQVQICQIVETQSGQSANAEGLFYQLIVRLHKFSLGRVDFNDSSHWQRGLVLDDDYNGRALLEHTGNDVRITVRAAYPEAFLSVLTHEVKWMVECFWKGMRCDVMVPCLNRHPCNGLFEVRRLIENKKRGRPEQPCAICNEWQNIEELLHNAPADRPPVATELQVGYQEFREELSGVRTLLVEQHGVAMHQFHGLNVITRRLLSKVDDAFAGIMTALTDEAKDGPRLFTMDPVEPGFLDKPKWIAQKFHLTLWCEHSRLPIWALSEHDKRGIYEMSVTRDWFVKAAPFLKAIGTTLSLALPVASTATKVLLNDATFTRIERQLDFGQKSIEALVKGGEKIGEWLGEHEDRGVESSGVTRAEGATLRELHSWLAKRDAGFGGLARVQNKRREFVWVHPMFEREY